MYNNIEMLIEEGRELIESNRDRDITIRDVKAVKDRNEREIYPFGADMFYMGIAIGARIKSQERHIKP